MSVLAGVAFGTQIANLAEKLTDVGTALDTQSLAAYVKPATIDSRVFIEEELVNADITKNIIRVSHSLYISWILTAMQISNMVTKTRSVGDMLRTVATENIATPDDPFVEDLTPSLETFGQFGSRRFDQMLAETRNDWSIAKEEKESKEKSFDSLPAGRVVTLTLENPEVPGRKVDIDVTVQLSPYAVPSDAIKEFIGLNYSPSLKQRFLQWKAGEISFWSDLVFCSDLTRNRRNRAKQPGAEALAEILREQSEAMRKYGANAFSGKNARRNIANAIMIVDANTFKSACREYGYDFDRAADRERFFRLSFMMIIAVVDTMYSSVDLYINGIAKSKTYNFKDFEKAKSNGSNDLVSLLQAMQQGSQLRF